MPPRRFTVRRGGAWAGERSLSGPSVSGRSPEATASASRPLTVDGARRHGLYGEYGEYGEYGNARVDEHGNAYLCTGRLPAHDLTCGT